MFDNLLRLQNTHLHNRRKNHLHNFRPKYLQRWFRKINNSYLKCGFLDDIMLFKSELAYAENPNDYSVHIPFDYNADNKDVTVINGGIGFQKGYQGNDVLLAGETNTEASPATGDENKFAPVFLIGITSALIVVLTKKKRRDCFEK